MNVLKIKNSNPEMFKIDRPSDDPKGFWRTEIVAKNNLREIMASCGVPTIEIDKSIKEARRREGEPVLVGTLLRNIRKRRA
jgi:hypothetical protein